MAGLMASCEYEVSPQRDTCLEDRAKWVGTSLLTQCAWHWSQPVTEGEPVTFLSVGWPARDPRMEA